MQEELVESTINDLLKRVQKIEDLNIQKLNEYVGLLDRVLLTQTILTNAIVKVLTTKNIVTLDEFNKLYEEEKEGMLKNIQQEETKK